jgi:hypothetical protein
VIKSQQDIIRSNKIQQFKLLDEWKIPSQSGYSFSPVSPNELQSLSGGYSRNQAQTRRQQFSVTAPYYLGCAAEINSFYIWYNAIIEEGSLTFITKQDFTGELLEYECQLTATPSFSGFTGEFAIVTMNMLCIPNFDLTAMETEYGYNSMFPSDEYLLGFMSMLPYALDPMGYTAYVPPL